MSCRHVGYVMAGMSDMSCLTMSDMSPYKNNIIRIIYKNNYKTNIAITKPC